MWSQWSSYGPCDVTCGGGVRSRNRTCLNMQESLTCPGDPVEFSNCSSRVTFFSLFSLFMYFIEFLFVILYVTIEIRLRWEVNLKIFCLKIDKD